MNRDRRRAEESERLYEEQRARVSTIDATGIFGAAIFGAVLLRDGGVLVTVWAVVLLSQVAAGVLTRRITGPAGRWVERWWVNGSFAAWAVLPLLVFDEVVDPELAWVLTGVLLFGIASDAVYLPQTYRSNVVLDTVIYSTPYLFALGYHDQWAQVVLVLGFILHVGWGTIGLSGLVEDLINRRVDAVIAADRADLSARTDPLTGLLNRSGLMADLRTHAARGEVVTCVFVDLDDFKLVNDRLGYDAGDRLLARFALSLRATVPDDWSVARFGGDEFVAAGVGGDVDDIIRQLEGLRIAPDRNVFSQHRQFVRASAGIVSLPTGGPHADALISEATAALREAKRTGKGSVVVSDEAFRAELRREREQLEHLDEAIANGEFVPFLHPIVHLDSEEVVAVEVLARWRRGDELVFPDEFLPQVEQRGVQHDLDRAMIERGIETLRSLADAGRGDITVSVNIAAGHLRDPELPRHLALRLAAADVPAERLVLEVVESDDLTDGGEAVRVAAELRAMGVGLAIDDFGTGYSSITQLLMFPFTEMKLDRSLVGRVGSPEADDLLTALADFGRRNGLRVVAEGIENEQQLSAVRSLGVRTAQGYLFDRPAPAADVIDALVRKRFDTAA